MCRAFELNGRRQGGLPRAPARGTGSSLLTGNAVERYMAALIETGLGALVLETAVAVGQYDLQRTRGDVVATDTVVVGVPGR